MSRKVKKPPFGLSEGQWMLLKWAMMFSAIVWTLIFQLGEDLQSLPEFIYVNF